MEVFFMGVRLYSKLQSNTWPNVTMFAQKAKAAYDAYVGGEDIEEFETVAGLKNAQLD